MFNNNLYNLMMQATVEHLSLWRIKKDYLKDAKKSSTIKKFWTKIAAQKENHLKELKSLIKRELK